MPPGSAAPQTRRLAWAACPPGRRRLAPYRPAAPSHPPPELGMEGSAPREALTFAGAGSSAWRPGPAGEAAAPRAELGGAGLGGTRPRQPYGEWNQKRCQIPVLPQSPPHRRTGGVRPGQVGQQGVQVGGVLAFGPHRGHGGGRASPGWSGAQSSVLLGSQFRGSPAPRPQLRPRVPLPHLQPRRQDGSPGPAGSQLRGRDRSKARLTEGPTGVDWPLAGGERLTVTSAMGSGGGAGPAPGTEPAHGHTDSPCPAGPGRRDQSHRPGTSSGAALKGPGARPARPAQPAPPGRRPAPPRPRLPDPVEAEPGAERR